MKIFSTAWRNVWRNKRRSLVTIAAISFALFVEILYSGLITGYLKDMKNDVLDLELGDIQIYEKNYQDHPSINNAIMNTEPLFEKLNKKGYKVTGRLMAGGFAAAGEYSEGVALFGINVDQDSTVSLIGEKVADGKWLDKNDPFGVVIGRRLAKTILVKPGDKLAIVSQGADGSIANDLYTVRGILLGIADGTDRGGVFMTDTAFRNLMVFPKGVHKVIIRHPKDVDLKTASATVKELAKGMDVKTWEEIMPVIATMLQSTQGMMKIIFFIIYIAVGILILNAMLMAVFERIREFGMLKALGAGPFRIAGLIFIESAFQTLIAIICGILFSLPCMWYMINVGINVGKLGGMSAMGVAMRPVWYGVYNIDTLKTPLVMLIFVVFFAVLYPALKAAMLSPVEAMRHK